MLHVVCAVFIPFNTISSDYVLVHHSQHTAEVVNHILMLPMQIVSAEYQFDRTKLFIYYTANTRYGGGLFAFFW